MSIHGPQTAAIGDSIKLSCRTNLPTRDIDYFEWIKIDSDGNKMPIYGVVQSNGAYKLEIANVSHADEGAFLCIVSYSIGEFGQVKMQSINLQISGIFYFSTSKCSQQ